MPTRPIDRIRESGFYELKKESPNNLCLVRGCRNECRCEGFGVCQKHYRRWWRLNNPQKSAYARIKAAAKRRRLEFTISFDYFCGLTDAFNYHEHDAEQRKEVPSIDRVDATKGYVPGNLRIVTVSENSAKGRREMHLPEHVQSMLQRRRFLEERLEEEEDDDVFPF